MPGTPETVLPGSNGSLLCSPACILFIFGGIVLKRVLDLLLGGFFLAFAFPVLLVAAVLVFLETGEPPLFRQARMGRNFRPFRILKLRTMRAGPGGSPYTFGHDPRITRVGYWLRRFKLDELPQLWNVLRGHMSLVGPRPVIPALAEEFRADYEELLQVRPGLTDPATLKYCRESELLGSVSDPMLTFKEVVTPDKLRISRAYQRRATAWTDLALLSRTALAVFQPEELEPAQPAIVLAPASTREW